MFSTSQEFGSTLQTLQSTDILELNDCKRTLVYQEFDKQDFCQQQDPQGLVAVDSCEGHFKIKQFHSQNNNQINLIRSPFKLFDEQNQTS